MKTLLMAILFFFSCPLFSKSLPDLSSQGSWGKSEKKQFLDYLKSGKQMPINGEVKTYDSHLSSNYRPSKASYLTFNLTGNTMLLSSGNQDEVVSANFGAKLLYGRHLFSWIRYYTGIHYNAIDQENIYQQDKRLNHFTMPFGIEFALIPLGTPHTRYVLLRAGASVHYIDGNAKDEDFEHSLLGVRASWDLGLGYEWQITDSNWRVHFLMEGYMAASQEKGAKISGLNGTFGVVYTL